MNKVIVLLSLLIYFPLQLEGQKANFEEGFVITNNRDTLFGVINSSFKSNNVVEFKDHKSPNRISFLKPMNILEAHFGEQSILSIKITSRDDTKEVIFMKQMLRGKINLFRGFSDLVGKIYFISREGREKPEAINKKAKQIFFVDYFSDCDSVTPKVAFTYNSFYQNILLYNQCLYPGNDIQVLEKLAEPIRFGLNVDAGPSFQTYKFYGWHEKEEKSTSTSVGFSVGAFLALNKFVHFNIAVGYLNKEIIDVPFGRYYRVNRIWGWFESDVSFKYQLIEVPIGFSLFLLNKNKSKMGVSAGTNWLIPIKATIENDISNPAVPLLFSNPEPTIIKTVSYYLGLDYVYKISEKNYISLKGKYSLDMMDISIYYEDPGNTVLDQLKTKRLDIRLKYYFLF